MNAEQLLTWVDRQIVDYSPTDADAGEIRNRFSRVLSARADWTGSEVFGFTIPSQLVDEVKQSIAKRLDAALATWREFLATIDGGPDYYQRSVVSAGLAPPAPRELVKDPAVTKAVALLRARLADTAAATALWRERGWLEDDQQHAYAISAPSPGLATALARFAAEGEVLPPMLEALYSELGGLWIGGAEQGGECAFDVDAEYFVLAPLTRVLEHDSENYILDQHPDHFSWVTLDRETGVIATANKLDREPKQIAGSLVEYLELLANGYGQL